MSEQHASDAFQSECCAINLPPIFFQPVCGPTILHQGVFPACRHFGDLPDEINTIVLKTAWELLLTLSFCRNVSFFPCPGNCFDWFFAH